MLSKQEKQDSERTGAFYLHTIVTVILQGEKQTFRFVFTGVPQHLVSYTSAENEGQFRACRHFITILCCLEVCDADLEIKLLCSR